MESTRLWPAVDTALASGNTKPLFEELARSSNLPSPTPNMDLARSVAAKLVLAGRRADEVIRMLACDNDEYPRIVAAFAFAGRLQQKLDARGALADLQIVAEDPRRHVQEGIVASLRMLIADRSLTFERELAAFMDGYLHAHLVLQALADKDLLASIRDGADVLKRLDEAFRLSDLAPRAADRSQGVRTLRRELPRQIAIIAARFPEVRPWLEGKVSSQRPETREVIDATIAALKKASLPRAEAARLTAALIKTAPIPRDVSRIVLGTRKRGKGRR